MEVLTIVAYNQPVTKSFVEHIRGIDSSSVVNSLVEKELLEEAGRLDIPGKPIAYRTTNAFLRCFRLSSLAELPPLSGKNEQVSFDDVSADDFQREE
ncbi:MAG: SMC-Scp complex subunit ScpB, partial [Oscillospiraceae bacterium]|jgi:segregation and condensation protein B